MTRQSRRLFLSLLAAPLAAGCVGGLELIRVTPGQAGPGTALTGPAGTSVDAAPAETAWTGPAQQAIVSEPFAQTAPPPASPSATPRPAPALQDCAWGPCDDWDAQARWIDTEAVPLPAGRPEPLPFGPGPRDPSAVSRFRAPLPRVPVWNPPGKKRVGLQAGHWETYNAPDELASLRSNPGSSGGGKAEWEVVLEIAQRAAKYLEDAGVEVDVLPTTIPVRYRAHAFVAIHGDGDIQGALHGYKLTRPSFSSVPEADDAFATAMYEEYGRVTSMPRDDLHISGRMLFYYAFNSRRYQHAVAPGVPQQILETGFMTSAIDRAILIGNPDLPARGIAAGVLAFLAQEIRD